MMLGTLCVGFGTQRPDFLFVGECSAQAFFLCCCSHGATIAIAKEQYRDQRQYAPFAGRLAPLEDVLACFWISPVENIIVQKCERLWLLLWLTPLGWQWIGNTDFDNFSS